MDMDTDNSVLIAVGWGLEVEEGIGEIDGDGGKLNKGKIV